MGASSMPVAGQQLHQKRHQTSWFCRIQIVEHMAEISKVVPDDSIHDYELRLQLL